MARVRLSGDRLYVGEEFSVSLQRTLRVPDTGEFDLPAGLGAFPIVPIHLPLTAAPPDWQAAPQFAIPMYQREALWIGFLGEDTEPRAVQIAAGGVNVISGAVWSEGLHDDPQDYIVAPHQPWLDGFNTGDARVRQFVALPLGRHLTAEEELTPSDKLASGSIGGLQFAVYPPKPGFVPPAPEAPARAAAQSMGLGAGGVIRQKVYPDPHGLAVWDQPSVMRIVVHLLGAEEFRSRTGHEPPPSPIDMETYVRHGLPWFELYDEDRRDVSAPDTLSGLKGITARETRGTREKGRSNDG
jgi:hypothetical protein